MERKTCDCGLPLRAFMFRNGVLMPAERGRGVDYWLAADVEDLETGHLGSTAGARPRHDVYMGVQSVSPVENRLIKGRCRGGRPALPPDQRRAPEHKLEVNLTATERAIINERAAGTGLPPQVWARAMLLTGLWQGAATVQAAEDATGEPID